MERSKLQPSRLTFESIMRHTFRKREICKQDVCSSPKIKFRVKLRSLLTCSFLYIKTKQKKAANRGSGLFLQRDVKNSILMGKFSVETDKNLASLKCLHKLIPMPQLKYSILQSS